MYNGGLKKAARTCLQDAGANTRRVLLLYLAALLVLDLSYSLISTFLELAMSGAAGGLGSLGFLKGYNTWYVIAPLVVGLVGILWNAGYTAWALHVSQGKPAGAGDLLAGFRLVGRVLWLCVLEYVFVFLWSLLFIIPGLVAAYRYRMAMYALLEDPNLTAREALELSKRMMRDHKLELFVLDLSFWWYYLLVFAVSAIGTAGDWVNYIQTVPVWLTGLDLWTRFGIYLVGELGVMVVQWLALPYVQTTYAHAYNYLRDLSDRRYLGNQAPDEL